MVAAHNKAKARIDRMSQHPDWWRTPAKLLRAPGRPVALTIGKIRATVLVG